MKYAHANEAGKILGWYDEKLHGNLVPAVTEKVEITPASEAVYDEAGSLVSEAIDAVYGTVMIKDAYYDISNIPQPNIAVTDEQWAIAINSQHNKVNSDGTTELFDFRTQAEVLEQAISHFKGMTYQHINAHVKQYDADNQTDYKSIESFAKYAAVPASSRYDISVRFILWASNIWDAVNSYHAKLTSIPTDEEFQAVLDGVEF